MSNRLIEKYIEDDALVCPSCKHNNYIISHHDGKEYLVCSDCNALYPVLNNSPLLISEDTMQSEIKNDIQKFWGNLYHAAYKDHHSITSCDDFLYRLERLKELFKTREHLAVTEMPIDDLSGKKVLEIGPGAGAHSSLFCLSGAEVVSIDITLDRVAATQNKFKIMKTEDRCMAMQGDAENLPFADGYFDIVYSNGVLHHTPDTEKALNEVFRVLKDGGDAVIMLYAKHSYLYWVNIFFLRGVLQGNIFKGGNWLGRVTEWMASDDQTIYNPETKVYTVKQLKSLFNSYSNVHVRKSSFHFIHIPYIGKLISRGLEKFTGVNESGYLIYDQAWRNETKLELWLGRLIGFNLNIKARK